MVHRLSSLPETIKFSSKNPDHKKNPPMETTQVLMTISELKEKSIAELGKLARALEIPGTSALRKQDLIFKILQAQSEKEGHIFAEERPRDPARRLRLPALA